MTAGQEGEQPVTVRCPECQSTDVVKDAAACWDEGRQEWTLLSVYDSTTCQTCEYESDYRFERIPLTSIGEQPPA